MRSVAVFPFPLRILCFWPTGNTCSIFRSSDATVGQQILLTEVSSTTRSRTAAQHSTACPGHLLCASQGGASATVSRAEVDRRWRQTLTQH
ncbi:hypothetical protein V8C44DRAFT_220961 [Trichoderma aethiopicum]